jgi:chromate reductase, NAD(P)H dehydrogenase (quinone)
MPEQRDVAVIVGSLRKESLNRRMARNLETLAPAHLRLQIVEIRDLPLYDQDLDSSPPAPWVSFRDRIRRAHAVLFVTPEYNRSIPAPLKNAIDVGSRPYGQSAWSGKAAAIVSVSPSAMGGFGANHHLRQSLVFLDMPAMQQPEAYIGRAGEIFDKDGDLPIGSTREFMTGFMVAFSEWIGTVTRRA